MRNINTNLRKIYPHVSYFFFNDVESLLVDEIGYLENNSFGITYYNIIYLRNSEQYLVDSSYGTHFILTNFDDVLKFIDDVNSELLRIKFELIGSNFS